MSPVFDRAAYGYSGEWTFDNQLWFANGRREHSVSTSSMWVTYTPDQLGWGGWRRTTWPTIIVVSALERARARAARMSAPFRVAWRRAGDAIHVLRRGMTDEDCW